MNIIEKKWYPGLLKDNTCSLLWGSDNNRKFKLLHSLLQKCHGETIVLTNRPNAVWGMSVHIYSNNTELQHGLNNLFDQHKQHINFILDIGLQLNEDQQQQLSAFIATKREHNTTLLVLCDDLQLLGKQYYHFDLVFHTVCDQPGTTQYQRWVNQANQYGVLVTDSLEWLFAGNPEHLPEISLLGVLIEKN